MQRSSWRPQFLGILALVLLPQESLAKECDDPVVEHGIKLSGFEPPYTVGSNITFECKIGYFMIGSYLIKCTGNSSWYPEVPSCKKITSELCGAPLIPSGKVEPLQPQYEIGHVIDVHCDANYCFPDETIEMSVECQGYNLWNPPVQPCFFRTSHDTSVLFIYNGKIIRGKKKIYEPGDKVTVQCNAGFALSGPAEIRYIGGKKWLPAIPTCSLNAFFILLITAFVLIVLLLAIKMIYQKYRSL